MSKYNDGKHARYKLREIMKFAKMLHDYIDKEDELPEWIMDKFTVSANDLNESYQYLENKGIEKRLRGYVQEAVHEVLNEGSKKQKLADEIESFLDQYANVAASYDPEWDLPEEKYSSPDADEMNYAKKMLKRGKVPDVPNSSWQSGGYSPLNSNEGKRKHDRIIQKIKDIQ